MLVCKICGKEGLKNLEAHIRRLHHISREEYCNKYNYDGIFAEPLSEETKSKISENKKGKPSWNKGLTKEDHPSLISKRKGIKLSDEERKVISEKTKEAMQRPEVKERLKIIGLNFKSDDPKTRRKVAIASIKHWENNEYASKCRNNKYGIKTEYNGIMFRSKTEVRFAKCLDDNNIKYEYEKYIFKYLLPNGLEHNYRPDFYLPQYDLFLEIKSKINEKDELVKIKLESVKNRGKKILLLDLSSLKGLKSILYNYKVQV